jgi:hypothetical protein
VKPPAQSPTPCSRRQFLRPLGIVAIAAGLGVAPASTTQAASPATPRTSTAPLSARILKVLPHLIDKEGRHTINPSHFDRDAYQFELRRNRDLCSGMRFDVLWKTRPARPAALTLKLELRGSKASAQNPVLVTARAFARGGFSQWTRVPVTGSNFEALGELLSWRATLWQEDRQLAEQKSFLW